MSKIKLAVITGKHPYEVLSFQELFKSMQDIDSYPQHIEEFSADQSAQKQYDVLLFYNFNQETPLNTDDYWQASIKSAIENIGETRQGIVILHHAILAFPDWGIWSDICGIKNRRFNYYLDQSIKVNVETYEHPIVRSIKDWEMIDETYTMDEPGEDSFILLSTHHYNSMKALAWTRQYKNARIFCYQSGHDSKAYNNDNFRKVLKNGIIWVAGII